MAKNLIAAIQVKLMQEATYSLVIKFLGPCLSPKSESVHHKSLRLQIQCVHLFLRHRSESQKGIQRGNIALQHTQTHA